ncbi:MAG: menaquinone biosynthesis decarboxylase [Candidatus Schekmanbacteria bacterium]|nr:menaquinone biosynthesis decarboxylase [Candidatus Schekmanbacteria bacterium]
MAGTDLRGFIAQLKPAGELQEISAPVDAKLEISEIYNRVVKRAGPALLFNNVKGYKTPVLINAFGSLKRVALALGSDSLAAVQNRIASFLKNEFPKGITQPDSPTQRLASFQPRIVNTAPCKEIILKDKFSLLDLPLLQCWPEDHGIQINLASVFTKDQETGTRNVGIYRMQVVGEKATGIHWQIHKHGAINLRKQQKLAKPMEVAVAIGCEPGVCLAAFSPMPEGFDELLLAGFLCQNPIPIIKCETVDLYVPANAEIILEGYINPYETILEGPFGERTGYYSPTGKFPKFNVTCLTMRKNPIYQTTVVGRPPMEDYYMGAALMQILLPVIQLYIPEIVDINLPAEGILQNIVIVSIKKEYPWQARKVMHALWGMGQMMFFKVIVVVDADVNVHNLSEVLWQVGNNIDPKWDVTFTEGPVGELDHSSRERHLGTKMGIDATAKMTEEGCKHTWPAQVKMRQDIEDLVTGRWVEYGIKM